MQAVPRRQFVKGLFLATVSSTFMNKPWSDAFASEIALTNPANGIIRINLQDYPPLQQEFGSIRVGVNPVGPDNFPQGYFWPVIISRGAMNDFYCLNSECRHASCVVYSYDPGEGGLRCHCHGSLYGIDGSVLEGPTQFPLDPYDFSIEGDLITIQVPNLGYAVKTSPLASPNSRLRLEFHGYPSVFYEIHFREKLSDAWSPIPFARTPNGPADETVLLGEDIPVAVYLDRTTPTGFYAASMRLSDVT